jgi:hypothetical protein
MSNDAANIKSLDWRVIMLNQKNPALYGAALSLQSRCGKFPNISCFEVLMSLTMAVDTNNEMGNAFWEHPNL